MNLQSRLGKSTRQRYVKRSCQFRANDVVQYPRESGECISYSATVRLWPEFMVGDVLREGHNDFNEVHFATIMLHDETTDRLAHTGHSCLLMQAHTRSYVLSSPQIE